MAFISEKPSTRGITPRAHDRVIHRRDVLIRVAPYPGFSLVVHTIDLSRGGVKIFTGRTVKPGDSVELTWADREDPVTLTGGVVYVRPVGTGFCAGVQFREAISAATLLDLKRRPEDQTSDLRLGPGESARGGLKRLA